MNTISEDHPFVPVEPATDPKPIALFATPSSRDALHNYMQLFTVEDEKAAADLGHDNFANPQLEGVIENLEPEQKLIALVVAGMRWNLMCKELEDARGTERDSEQNTNAGADADTRTASGNSE